SVAVSYPARACSPRRRPATAERAWSRGSCRGSCSLDPCELFGGQRGEIRDVGIERRGADLAPLVEHEPCGTRFHGRDRALVLRGQAREIERARLEQLEAERCGHRRGIQHGFVALAVADVMARERLAENLRVVR